MKWWELKWTSSLKTSTPHKTTDAQPVEHEVEDFFADSFFNDAAPSETVLEKCDSNEQPVVFGKSVSKRATSGGPPPNISTLRMSCPLKLRMWKGICPISDDFMQMMEFDNNSRGGGPAELESQKDLQPAPEIAVEATSVDSGNTDGKEELFLDARDAVGADRKVVEVNEEKDESSGSSAVAVKTSHTD